MSVIENIQKLFKTKPAQPEDSLLMAPAGLSGEFLAANGLNETSRGAANYQPAIFGFARNCRNRFLAQAAAKCGINRNFSIRTTGDAYTADW